MPTDEHLFQFPPTLAGLEAAATSLRQLLEARQVSTGPRYNAELAFDEVASNIVRHGSPSSDVQLLVRLGDDEIVMRFEDDGPPFDPHERPEPVLPTSIEQAKVGGLGLVLLRNILTRMDYERTPQKNLLTLVIQAR